MIDLDSVQKLRTAIYNVIDCLWEMDDETFSFINDINPGYQSHEERLTYWLQWISSQLGEMDDA